MDKISKEHRSWNMSRIKGKDTKPELIVRSALHRMGYRFRLNGKVSRSVYAKGILPGKPDIVLMKYKTVIFVNGCFWHHHKDCKRSNIPKTNNEYWNKKILNNVERDNNNHALLIKNGWVVIVLWECEINSKIFYDILETKVIKVINIR